MTQGLWAPDHNTYMSILNIPFQIQSSFAIVISPPPPIPLGRLSTRFGVWLWRFAHLAIQVLPHQLWQIMPSWKLLCGQGHCHI